MVIKIDYKFVVTFLLILILLFLFIDNKVQNKQKEITDLKNSILESEGFHKNEKLKLTEAISKLDAANSLLKDKIDNIKDIGSVEYIIETKYITKTVTESLDSVPKEYIYFDSNNIPVCKFEMKKSAPVFSTLPLDYTLSTIIEEDYNYSILNIKDYTGKNYEILMSKEKLESKVIEIKKDKKIINPKISLGLSFNYSDTVSLSPVLNLNLIELNPRTNVLSPSILLKEKALGLSLIDYNIGSKNTIISDSWLGFGLYSDLNKTYYSINISSRF